MTEQVWPSWYRVKHPVCEQADGRPKTYRRQLALEMCARLGLDPATGMAPLENAHGFQPHDSASLDHIKSKLETGKIPYVITVDGAVHVRLLDRKSVWSFSQGFAKDLGKVCSLELYHDEKKRKARWASATIGHNQRPPLKSADMGFKERRDIGLTYQIKHDLAIRPDGTPRNYRRDQAIEFCKRYKINPDTAMSPAENAHAFRANTPGALETIERRLTNKKIPYLVLPGRVFHTFVADREDVTPLVSSLATKTGRAYSPMLFQREMVLRRQVAFEKFMAGSTVKVEPPSPEYAEVMIKGPDMNPFMSALSAFHSSGFTHN